MLTVPCPNCSRSLVVREEAAGNEIRCVCGHRFVPTMPTSGTDGAGGDTFDRQTSSESQSVWNKALFSTENRTNPIPSRGSIKCPYCDCVVVQDAKLLGQTILCPKCHAQFKAPRSGATEFHSNSLGKPELRPTLLKVFGVLLLVIACISGLRFLSMDTSVAVEHQVNGWTQVERVNNLGLMDDRRNWLIISGFTALIGALFFGLGFLVEKRPVSTGEALDAKVGDSNTPRS